VPADEFDPERILRVLADHGVDCLIVGGFGAQAHGAHRQTLDIDVVPRGTTRTWSDSPPPCAISAHAFEWAA
jgi:hypothetical protein